MNDRCSRLTLYTREGGRVYCTVYGHKWHPFLTPASIVEVSVQHNPVRNLTALLTAERLFVPQRDDMSYHCALLFVAEVMNKTLLHPMADEVLFDALRQELIRLHALSIDEDYAQQFMTRFSVLLGYGGEPLEEWRAITLW